MPANKNVIPELIHLVEMKILKAELQSSSEFDMTAIEKFDIGNELTMGFNLENNLVKAELQIDVQTTSLEEHEQEEANANFLLEFLFEIDNLNDLAKQAENGEIQLQGNLGNAISSITYSTTRGILMTRFQGTVLRDFILPVINPNKLL